MLYTESPIRPEYIRKDEIYLYENDNKSDYAAEYSLRD